MVNSLREKRVYEFGNFRLDTCERVLTRAGDPVSIAPKALEVLIALVEDRGHIVEKQDLMRQVWPDTFVEENNLAFNISVLRKLLGDTSTAPCYIETVPKRGYRFIAEAIEVVSSGLPEIRASELTSTPEQANGIPVQAPERVARTAKLLRRRFVLAAALFAAAAIAFLTFRLKPTRKLTDKDIIVLADFANKTGDPVFDGTLRQGLTIQLEQSPFISVASEEHIRHTLRLMSQPADAPLTPELAREVCERNGSTAVLEGSIASLGSQYVLALHAKNCASGDVIDDEQVQVTRKEDVLNAVTQLARRFRSRMGESLPSLERHDTPLIEATTPSLEALKAYSASIRVGYARGCAASVPFGRRAVELDPQFAMAHSHLGRCYANLGESVLADESIEKAYELKNRAGDRERFYIRSNYERQVLGNLAKAQETAELWAQTYPRDPISHGTLSGLTYQGSGKYEQAIEEANKTIALDPDIAPAYVNLGFANCYLGRVKQAERALQMASERNLDTPDLLLLRYYIAFLNGDEAGMQQAAARAAGRAGAEDSMSHSQSLFLARSGRIKRAGEMSSRAVELARQAGQRERAATYESGSAVWNALFGNNSAAKRSATEALALSNGRDVEYALLSHWRCGRLSPLAGARERSRQNAFRKTRLSGSLICRFCVAFRP